jgi:hypothetical protein
MYMYAYYTHKSISEWYRQTETERERERETMCTSVLVRHWKKTL